MCRARASINDGSYDPDGDPITLRQAPPRPYSVGATNVTLTVTDSHGATDQAMGSVTVVDATAPRIQGVSSRGSSGVPIVVNYRSFDNCGHVRCVLSVSSHHGTARVIDAHHFVVSHEGEYRLSITCTDDAGNVTEKSYTTVVSRRHTRLWPGPPRG